MPYICLKKSRFGVNIIAKRKTTCLDVFSDLYKKVCPSVGPSIGPSVRPSELKLCKSAVFDQNYYQYQPERILCRVSGLVPFLPFFLFFYLRAYFFHSPVCSLAHRAVSEQGWSFDSLLPGASRSSWHIGPISHWDSELSRFSYMKNRFYLNFQWTSSFIQMYERQMLQSHPSPNIAADSGRARERRS